MRVVILCGGAGTRLWPLSQPARPKPVLKVLRDDESKPESMLGRIVRLLTRAGIAPEQIGAVCGTVNYEAIKSELDACGITQLLVEPSARSTYPACLLACAQAEAEGAADEPLVIMPADCFAEQSFFDQIATMGTVLEATGAALALMGAKPTAALTGYGYIVLESNKPVSTPAAFEANATVSTHAAFEANATVSTHPVPEQLYSQQVAAFVEKPDEQHAATLIAGGALWNMGIFCLRPSWLLSQLGEVERKALQRLGTLDVSADARAVWEQLEATSFDYKIIEKVVGAGVVRVCAYHGVWSDIGSWQELLRYMKPMNSPDGITYDLDEHGTHLISYQRELPIACLGLEKMLVCSTAEGLLIASIDELGELSQALSHKA